MILQALYDYYQRKAADPDSGIAPEGFEWKEIPFLIVIDRAGRFVALEDTRTGEGKKLRAKRYLVPRASERSGSKSHETTQLLWDHVGYILQASRSSEDKDMRKAELQHAAWLRSLEALPQPFQGLQGVVAVRAFYRARQIPMVLKHEAWSDCEKIPGCIVAFRIEGELEPVPSSTEVHSLVRQARAACAACAADGESSSEVRSGRCLLTGETGPLKRTHAKTAISKDSKALVSFQKNSGYDSYQKEQAYNAPISVGAEFAYTTALNTLLAKDSTNRMSVVDSTVVFWAERRVLLEDVFASFFTMAPKDDPDREAEAVRSLYQSIDTGAADTTSETRFFVLGLAPSAFRIAVRFWHQGTVGELSGRIKQHFDDLEIVRGPKDTGRYSLYWVLKDIAAQGEVDKVPPSIAGNVVRAILEGTPYPTTLLQQAIRRIRAEQTVTRLRAAILKACLNRFHRAHPTPEKEITVSLDLESTNAGYRLGRLFAVLEKIQEDANPGINATIRERFYGAASASPVTVFPQLLKLKNHHLKKLDKPGLVVAHERRLGEIFSGLPASMPAHLSMDDQARFAIGYYHQRQALFTKTPAAGSPSSEPSTES